MAFRAAGHPHASICQSGLVVLGGVGGKSRSLLQHSTDSYIMITWYVGQARLFSFQPT